MEHPRFHPIRQKLIAITTAVANAIPKLTVGAICAAAMVLALTAPASAQITIQFGGPQVPGFSNYYPWFNDVPQYEGNEGFRYFLAYHPNIARALSRNPGLLYNANWRAQYPQLQHYLRTHPYVWQALNDEYWSTGPAETQWGDYDDQHQWRDAYWWHQYNPDWFYQNHQDWASLNSRWHDQDGAYDQQRQWHDRGWWYQQNPNWVKANRPNWLRQQQNWTNQATQQRNQQPDQQRQAAREQQQRNLQQQQATHQQEQQNQQQENQRQRQENQQQRQESQQRTTDQRQANAQQQQNQRQDNQRQQQTNQQQHQVNQQQNQQGRGNQTGHGGGNQN